MPFGTFCFLQMFLRQPGRAPSNCTKFFCFPHPVPTKDAAKPSDSSTWARLKCKAINKCSTSNSGPMRELEHTSFFLSSRLCSIDQIRNTHFYWFPIESEKAIHHVGVSLSFLVSLFQSFPPVSWIPFQNK